MSSESIWFATLSDAERTELSAFGSDTLLETPDVLIVGGGLIGLSLAYVLADRGVGVQLVEAGKLTEGASGANFGGVWPNDQGPGTPAAFQELAFLSRDLWGRWSLRPGFNIDWRVNGLLNVNRERVGSSPETRAREMQEAGYTVTAVDSEQIALLEPNLKPGLPGGLHHPSEAQVHPVKASLSLARAATRKGAHIATDTRALAAETSSGRVTSVRTTRGVISPKYVISATGWTADWLQGTLAHTLPVRPVSGQVISTSPQPPLLKATVAGSVLLSQLRSGEVLVGASVVEGSTLIPDPQVTATFIAAARELLPALEQAEFVRGWCGIRPGTPDGQPIIDRMPGLDNAWLACGHFRNGVLLAPGTAKVLGDWIVDGEPSQDLSAFGCTRFFSA